MSPPKTRYNIQSFFHATKELLPITDVFKMVTVHTKPPVGLFDVLADLIDGVTGAVLAF
jgi:hypothetical protein